jgi:hypothetical protein
MGELQANVSYMHEYRQACLLAFTETWLDDHVQDRNLLIDGFDRINPSNVYVSLLTQAGAKQLLFATRSAHRTLNSGHSI